MRARTIAAAAVLAALLACGAQVAPCNLQGVAARGAHLCADRSTVDFGDVSTVVGQVARSSLLLRNGGTEPVVITGVARQLPAEVEATPSWGAGAATVAPGAAVSIAFTFTPRAAGAVTGTLTITTDAAGAVSVNVSGCGREANQPQTACTRP